MPAKKKGREEEKTPTPTPDDPDFMAKRAAEILRTEKAREDFWNEVISSIAHLQVMERVDRLVVEAEKERLLDPDGFKQKVAPKGQLKLHVKLMTGNRAIAQQNFDVILPEPDVSLLVLKVLIRNEAMRLGNPAERFAPSCQRLFAFGKDMAAVDEQKTGIRAFGVGPGSTIQLALVAGPVTTFPPQISRPRARGASPAALSPTK